METLTNADWQRLNEFLKSLYAPCQLEAFPIRLMAALSEITAADAFGVISFSIRSATLPNIITFPDPAIGLAATKFAVQSEEYFAQPVATHYVQTLDGQALAISDFLSESEFQRQCSPYVSYLKHFGIADQMGIFFELPSELKSSKVDSFHQNQEHFCLMTSRDCRNYTERDRLILNLIRPHLKQAYRTLVAFNDVNRQLIEQRAATEQAALIALTTSGTVKWITQQAGEILHRYFPPLKAQIALPSLLQQWVNRQLSMFLNPEEPCLSARPLSLQLGDRRLSIRCSYSTHMEQIYLVLEETQTNQFSVESLQLLGLTKRESEVLFWMAKDKSLIEVAKLLGMSDRTAKKHLEHIYEKFGVQTRLSAVMYALEHLGILTR